ncbi:hypothetical protein K469DRAFT_345876 [Zopfia rhizophila CBS 207.26]|uniref:Uncharacterized protein n=1 Tax=Zopfia rhizophila CBS 207.26 TaxID=1314779 RepID=A0A6A6EIS2_9PEZI|nr:hypothetical protein K469DRAFT_345876 [Zopfia rhizophila CBS 207.26]
MLKRGNARAKYVVCCGGLLIVVLSSVGGGGVEWLPFEKSGEVAAWLTSSSNAKPAEIDEEARLLGDWCSASNCFELGVDHFHYNCLFQSEQTLRSAHNLETSNLAQLRPPKGIPHFHHNRILQSFHTVHSSPRTATH